ncbi:hypothetical protein D3C73_1335070 [compost metagenome]
MSGTASSFYHCLKIFNFAFHRTGLLVFAVSSSPAVVVVNSKMFRQQVGQLYLPWETPVAERACYQDERRSLPDFIVYDLGAVL